MTTQTTTPKAKAKATAKRAASTTKPAAKAAAPKTAPKSRRVFAPGQCHHRNAQGAPDCKKRIEAKRANLCPTHEREWQKAARVRYAANRAAKAVEDGKAAKAAPAAKATSADELEGALEASVAAFATPQLAEKARQKRAAQKAARR